MRMAGRKGVRRGGSIVEFLLVVPTLLILLMTIIEFGKVYSDYMLLNQGTRQGVRLCSIGKTTSDIKAGILSTSFSDITDAEIAIAVQSSSDSRWSALRN